MAEKTSWIKIDRNILKWRWYQDTNAKVVFLHLLLTANIADHDFQNETIHRGQVATSIGNLAKAAGITYDQARRALDRLKVTNEITIRRRPKYLVISITNYGKYQERATQMPNARQTDAKRTPTIKEYKEVKEEKNYISTPAAKTDDKKAADPKEDYGGVWLTGAEWNELESMVSDKMEFLDVIDRVGEWLEDNPRPKSRHKSVVKTFLRNDGLI